jgi:hypothetical protein
LQWVPEKMRNHELCLMALSSEPTALAWVPESIRTSEFCMEILPKYFDRLLRK